MSGIFLLLGSNLGNKQEIMEKSLRLIEEQVGSVLKMSKMYETEAWGFEDQPNYLNQVIQIDTQLDPEALLKTILGIEKELGRKRYARWRERSIDIDILYYHDLVIDKPKLKVPHPEIQNRKFVLVPMVEIAPGYVHPKMGKDQKTLLKRSQDPLGVHPIEKA